jgi:hypothetical protein
VAEQWYEPELNTLAYDEAKGCVGQVMEVGPTQCVLRKTTGGVEWWVSKADLRKPTTAEELSPAVAEANARSRGELCP